MLELQREGRIFGSGRENCARIWMQNRVIVWSSKDE